MAEKKDEVSVNLKDYKYLKELGIKKNIQKQEKVYKYFAFVISIYTLLALIALYVFRGSSSFLLWPIVGEQNDYQYIEQVNNVRISKLEQENIELKKILQSTSTLNFQLNYFNQKYLELEERQKALEDTIMDNPEKALTSVLLREKQVNLEENFSRLLATQAKLEDNVFNFIIYVVAIPIIGSFLTALGWLYKTYYKKESI